MSTTDRKIHFQALFVRDPLTLGASAIPISQANFVFDCMFPYSTLAAAIPPYALTGWQVDGVQVFCTATVATASVDLRIARSIAAGVLTGGATVLTGAITPVAGSIVQGVLLAPGSRRNIAQADVIAGLATTNGTGTITNLAMSVTVRPFPLDNEAS